MITNILRKTGSNFIIRVLGRFLGFILSMQLARILGAKGFGDYSLAIAFITISSTLSRFGLDNAITKLSAIQIQNNSWKGALLILKDSMLIVLLGSGLVSLIIYYNLDYISSLTDKEDLRELLKNMIFAIPVFSISIILAQFLLGLEKSSTAQVVLTFIVPFVLIIYITFFWGNESNIISIAKAYTVSLIISVLLAVFGIISFDLSLPEPKSTISNYHISELFQSCAPLYISSVFSNLIQWSSILIAGIWLSSSDIGVLSIVQKIIAIIGFIQISFNTVTAPIFSALYAKQEINKLRLVAQKTTLITVVASTPIYIFILLKPELLLDIFGQEFSEKGVTILFILTISQLINIFSGPSGFLLMMSGNEKVFRNTSILSGSLIIALNLLLIPYAGLLGAAIALALAVIVVNLLNAIMVKRILGFWSFSPITLFNHISKKE